MPLETIRCVCVRLCVWAGCTLMFECIMPVVFRQKTSLFYWFWEREKNINLLFYLFMHSLISSCMYPDQRSNPQLWHIGKMFWPSDLPGQGLITFFQKSTFRHAYMNSIKESSLTQYLLKGFIKSYKANTNIFWYLQEFKPYAIYILNLKSILWSNIF